MTVETRTWSRNRAGEQVGQQPRGEQPAVGPLGYLFLLGWTLALVLLLPSEHTLLGATLALLGGAGIERFARGRQQNPVRACSGSLPQRNPPQRWLLFAGLMALPALLAGLERGPGPQALSVSSVSWPVLGEGLRMFVRAIVIMIAVNRFAGAVSISEIAALFERAGLKGLGFALGVAVNLLPILRRALSTTWHSMRLRGGFRRHQLQHLRLLLTTLLCNTLRRAESIALAAETRGYNPEKSRPAPLARGKLDLALAVAGCGLFLLLQLL